MILTVPMYAQDFYTLLKLKLARVLLMLGDEKGYRKYRNGPF